MKISKKWILLPISVLALAGCGNNEKEPEKDTGLPDAPVSKMSLTLADFCYSDVLPAPSITGLKAKDIKVTYSYLNNETSARIGSYVAGSAAGTINAGTYKLQADVKTSTYKPFTLKTTFNVTKAEMGEITFVAQDFNYVEEVPAAEISGAPAGTTVTYKYYQDEAYKYDYVVGEQNTIVPGEYTLEATFTNANYETVVKTDDFTVEIGQLGDIEMYAQDYKFDEVKPAPIENNVPAGVTKTYKYYKISSEKHDYVPGSANDIEPGSYTLEATYEKENFQTVIQTYGFVVLKAEFDAKYELNVNSIDLGDVMVNYDLDSVDLNDYFSIIEVATSQEVSGVTFTWKQSYSFDGDSNEAKIVAHKTNFNDKEYDITVSLHKKKVNIPGLFAGESGTDSIGYVSYDGESHTVHLAGVMDDYVNIVEGSKVFSATNAGVYHFEVALKDPTNTCWSDGSTNNKEYTFEIHKWSPAGASSGYRLTVGSFVGDNHETIMHIPVEQLTSPCTLKYEFLYEDWTNYSTFELEIQDVSASYAHINESGQLVFDDFTHTIHCNVKTTNPNHQFNQYYQLIPVLPSSRTLSFTPTQTTASCYGADETSVIPYMGDLDGDGSTYIESLYTGGDGLGIDRQFKSIDTFKIKFIKDEVIDSFSFQVMLKGNEQYTPDADQIVINHNIPSSYDGDWVVYNFSEVAFNPDINYYIRMWAGSGGSYAKVAAIQIDYTIAD